MYKLYAQLKNELEQQSKLFEPTQLDEFRELDEIFKDYDFDRMEQQSLNNPFYVTRLNILEDLHDLMIKISQDRAQYPKLMEEIMQYWAQITGSAEDYMISELFLGDLLDNGYITKADYEIYDVAKSVNRWL